VINVPLRSPMKLERRLCVAGAVFWCYNITMQPPTKVEDKT